MVFPTLSDSQDLQYSGEGSVASLFFWRLGFCCYPTICWHNLRGPSYFLWSTGSRFVPPLQFRDTKCTDLSFSHSPFISSRLLSTPTSQIQITLILQVFSNQSRNESWIWWLMPLLLALGTLSKKTACEFKATVGGIVRPHLKGPSEHSF